MHETDPRYSAPYTGRDVDPSETQDATPPVEGWDGYTFTNPNAPDEKDSPEELPGLTGLLALIASNDSDEETVAKIAEIHAMVTEIHGLVKTVTDKLPAVLAALEKSPLGKMFSGLSF
jgi:hypothetical protein